MNEFDIEKVKQLDSFPRLFLDQNNSEISTPYFNRLLGNAVAISEVQDEIQYLLKNKGKFPHLDINKLEESIDNLFSNHSFNGTLDKIKEMILSFTEMEYLNLIDILEQLLKLEYQIIVNRFNFTFSGSEYKNQSKSLYQKLYEILRECIPKLWCMIPIVEYQEQYILLRFRQISYGLYFSNNYTFVKSLYKFITTKIYRHKLSDETKKELQYTFNTITMRPGGYIERLNRQTIWGTFNVPKNQESTCEYIPGPYQKLFDNNNNPKLISEELGLQLSMICSDEQIYKYLINYIRLFIIPFN